VESFEPADGVAEGVAALAQTADNGGRLAGASRGPAWADGPRVQGNRVTAGRRQLRLGRDGLWYLFTEHFGDWTLAGPPAADPRELVQVSGG
jgi:hypothetical protein